MASWIESVYAEFGSGVTVDGMGFLLQNRGAGFTLEPNHPDVLAGGKRPFHTIIPAFMERGDLHIGFGIMGGAMASNLRKAGYRLIAPVTRPELNEPPPTSGRRLQWLLCASIESG
jgi:hypothetical protein